MPISRPPLTPCCRLRERLAKAESGAPSSLEAEAPQPQQQEQPEAQQQAEGLPRRRQRSGEEERALLRQEQAAYEREALRADNEARTRRLVDDMWQGLE